MSEIKVGDEVVVIWGGELVQVTVVDMLGDLVKVNFETLLGPNCEMVYRLHDIIASPAKFRAQWVPRETAVKAVEVAGKRGVDIGVTLGRSMAPTIPSYVIEKEENIAEIKAKAAGLAVLDGGE